MSITKPTNSSSSGNVERYREDGSPRLYRILVETIQDIPPYILTQRIYDTRQIFKNSTECFKKIQHNKIPSFFKDSI